MAKAAVTTKKESTIKYSDKSAGQPELVPVFDAIKEMLLPYVKGDMTVLGGSGGQISLINKRPVEIDGRKKDEMWFAAALIQKGYVGFYFMPVYSHAEMMEMFSEGFVKALKGKACFHIKKADPVIYADIKKALKLGYAKWKGLGWL